MAFKRLSDREVQRATELYAQGWPTERIGAELGVTGECVRKRLAAAGVELRGAGFAGYDAIAREGLDARERKALAVLEERHAVGLRRKAE
jgi:hypothetical protein